MVVGPHRKTILKVSGEDNKEQLEAAIYAAIDFYGIKNAEKYGLNGTPVPVSLEQDKATEKTGDLLPE